MIAKLIQSLRWVRSSISRNQGLVRILGLSVVHELDACTNRQALIMLQIDGLSRPDLEQALADGFMPFLSQLTEQKLYKIHSLYSGQPSSTPAAQGELFYGVKGCVPAFRFKQHQDLRTVAMLQPDTAARVEARLLEEGGQPLLQGGSSFSNVFTGGAKESSFCASSLGWSSIMPTNNPFKMAAFALLNLGSLVRVAVFMMVELVFAVVDFFKGLIHGRDLVQELKFIPTRVAASVLLREAVVIGASLDATRGLPIIHANFIGYDEQAHRRGPTSKFARWSLKGIDRAIRRICKTAKRNPHRNYQIWIHSDHGQEAVVPYVKMGADTIQHSVQRIYQRQRRQQLNKQLDDKQSSRKHQRLMGFDLSSLGKQLRNVDHRLIDLSLSESLEVVAMGPLGFIYLPDHLNMAQKQKVAESLVANGRVPLVMVADDGDAEGCRVLAWNQDGQFELPAEGARVLGTDHPFLVEASHDLASLVHHADAGDIVICGWSANRHPLSFRLEGGAHAGPGTKETHAFALLPSAFVCPLRGTNYLRMLHLREAALKLLGRSRSEEI